METESEEVQRLLRLFKKAQEEFKPVKEESLDEEKARLARGYKLLDEVFTYIGGDDLLKIIPSATYGRWQTKRDSTPRLAKFQKKIEDRIKNGVIRTIDTQFLSNNGILSEDDVVNRSKDADIIKTWVFSIEAFGESFQGELQEEIIDIVLRGVATDGVERVGRDLIYVFPNDSSGQDSFRLFVRRLERYSEEEQDTWKGRVIGVCVTDLSNIPMFLIGGYAVVWERKNQDPDAAFAFEVPNFDQTGLDDEKYKTLWCIASEPTLKGWLYHCGKIQKHIENTDDWKSSRKLIANVTYP